MSTTNQLYEAIKLLLTEIQDCVIERGIAPDVEALILKDTITIWRKIKELEAKEQGEK